MQRTSQLNCNRHSRAAGFTLIELLIVIGIVGLTASLVAPVGLKQVERARADAEWLTLSRTVTGLAFRAFAQGRSIDISADGTRLSWSASSGVTGELELERVFFPPGQRIFVTRNGVAAPSELRAAVAGEERILKLNAWLER